MADEVAQKAEVMLIGYAGGGTRNIFVNKPVRNLAEMKSLKVRVQGAPIWSKTFAAVGMAPTVIAYNEVYNAIQNGVIAAGENEAAGVEAMKFFEVAPEPQHDAARHHHPADLLLGQDLQETAARPAGGDHQGGQGSRAYGRQVESSEDEAKLDAMEKAGKLKRIPFADRAQMKKLADPVMEAYAKEIGADGDLPEDQRDQVTVESRRRRPSATAFLPDGPTGIRCEIPRRVPPAPGLAAGGDGRRS